MRLFGTNELRSWRCVCRVINRVHRNRVVVTVGTARYAGVLKRVRDVFPTVESDGKVGMTCPAERIVTVLAIGGVAARATAVP